VRRRASSAPACPPSARLAAQESRVHTPTCGLAAFPRAGHVGYPSVMNGAHQMDLLTPTMLDRHHGTYFKPNPGEVKTRRSPGRSCAASFRFAGKAVAACDFQALPATRQHVDDIA